MSSTTLYAEVLTNIRQVTFYAELETATNDSTKIDVSSDKKCVTVHHQGTSASIYLPTEILGTAQITLPEKRKKEISARLEIADASDLLPREHEVSSIEVPWSAKDLSPDTSVYCKSCNAQIVKSGEVRSWKDLPSENWAEMMDFWHCHKPHDDHAQPNGEAAEAKGYASTSKFNVSQGTAFVDTVSFFLDEGDCAGIEISSSRKDPESAVLRCTSCSTVLGQRDIEIHAHKIYKSRISVKLKIKNSLPQSFNAATFITAQLLIMASTQAIHKFILHSPNPSPTPNTTSTNPSLHLWLFNPDIHYSSSRLPPTPHRAAKVFYQPTSQPQTILDANHSTLEELVLSRSILEEFTETLEQSTQILPHSARKFQEWNVGLLDRYESQPVGLGAMGLQPLNRSAGEMSAWPDGVVLHEGLEGILQ